MKLLAGLLALACACLCGPAQAQSHGKLMLQLEFKELREIVEELDFAVTDEGIDADGDYYFEVVSDTGLPFFLYGARCDEANPGKGCMDLNAVGTFSPTSGADVDSVMKSISYAFMKVYRSGDDVKISRYLIFDGGLTRQNVKENIRVFAEIGDTIWGELTDAGVLAD